MGIYLDDAALISITEDGYTQGQFFANFGSHLFPCMYADEEGYTHNNVEIITSVNEVGASSLELHHLGNQGYKPHLHLRTSDALFTL